MKEFVSVAIGHKDGAGHWIIDEHIEVECFDTGISQIVITPSLAGSGLNLIHAETGLYLLGPFATMTAAREGAVKLSRLFPFRDLTKKWTPTEGKRLFRGLAPEDQEWMRQNGCNSARSVRW